MFVDGVYISSIAVCGGKIKMQKPDSDFVKIYNPKGEGKNGFQFKEQSFLQCG